MKSCISHTTNTTIEINVPFEEEFDEKKPLKFVSLRVKSFIFSVKKCSVFEVKTKKTKGVEMNLNRKYIRIEWEGRLWDKGVYGLCYDAKSNQVSQQASQYEKKRKKEQRRRRRWSSRRIKSCKLIITFFEETENWKQIKPDGEHQNNAASGRTTQRIQKKNETIIRMKRKQITKRSTLILWFIFWSSFWAAQFHCVLKEIAFILFNS